MIKAIVIGASFGGLEALKNIITALPPGFKTPVFIVLHIGNHNINTFISVLNKNTGLTVKEADEKETIRDGYVYFAPPNYHLQIEDKLSVSLSTSEKINFSRPSIDVLFETAAWTFKNDLLGILLTGSNNDGAEGLRTIKKYGGVTIVQNPETAVAKTMPLAGIKRSVPDYVLNLEEIAEKMVELTKN